MRASIMLLIAGLILAIAPSCGDELVFHRIVLQVAPSEAAGETAGEGEFPEGRVRKVYAFPNLGYRFVNWTRTADETEVSTDEVYEFTLGSSVDLTANFAQIPTYTVTIAASPADSGTVIGGEQAYTAGRQVTIQAFPKAGYMFTRWVQTANTNTVLSTNYTYTFSMPAQNVSYSALFAESITWNVTPVVAAGQESRGSVAGGGVVPDNFTGTVEAFPKFGFNFEKWTIGGATVGTTPKYEYEATNDLTITAHFVSKPTYLVTLSVNDAAAAQSVIGPDPALVMEGTPVIIQAYPKPGYRFVRWIDKNNGDIEKSTTAIYQFEMPAAAIHYQAVFEARADYLVTTSAWDLSAGAAGGGSFFGGNTNYQAGSLVVITAVPNIGYRFLRWRKDNATTGDIVSTEQTYVFTMPEGAVTYHAIFEKVPYTVTLKAIGGGQITVGGVTYTNNHQLTKYYNDKFTLVSAPSNATFFFTQWRFQLDGFDGTATPDPYPYTMPNANVTITANYELRFPQGGDGTAGNPFKIASGFQLNRIRDTLINSNHHFLIVSNINMSVIDYYVPIGSLSRPFKGRIQGNGHTISNLKVDRTIDIDNGLIGYMTEGSLSNIIISGAEINGGDYAGVLVGRVNANTFAVNISGCSVSGTVNGGSFTGGLIGYAYTADIASTVVKCSADVTVNGTGSVGGLIGYLGAFRTASGFMYLERSYATGSVTGSGTGIGGLVGYAFRHGAQGGNVFIQDCYATGAVTGGTAVGGLLGTTENPSTIRIIRNYSAGAVSGTTPGGLIGSSGALHTDSARNFWDTQTSGQAASAGGAYVAGKTTTEMKQKATFTDWDFDIVPIWEISEGNSYPTLK